MPGDLIGAEVQKTETRVGGFRCADCLKTENIDLDDEDTVITILSTDIWFYSDQCVSCSKWVEGAAAKGID